MPDQHIDIRIVTLLAGMLGLLGGCGSSPTLFEEQDGAPYFDKDVSDVPNAVPRHEPKSRYGNPSSYVVLGKRYHVMDSSEGFTQRGIASWYGTKFHGRRTSSGEPYDMYAMTAAHKSLPLPTYVEVRNLQNNRTVIVKVNDRGPFHEGRIIDLSYTAATKLGIRAKGTGQVEIRTINPSAPRLDPPVRSAETNPVVTVSTINKSPDVYLQIGAFISEGNAERLKSRLHEAAFPRALVTTQHNDGNTVYRVRIGPLTDLLEADQIVAQLSALGLGEAQIVTD